MVWWHETSSDESVSDIFQLNGRFLELRDQLPNVLGVGATKSASFHLHRSSSTCTAERRDRRWLPLLLIDINASQVWSRSRSAFVLNLPIPRPINEYLSAQIPFNELDPYERQVLGPLQPPLMTMILPIYLPKPCALEPGLRIVDGRAFASSGLYLGTDEEMFVLTAGHFFSGKRLPADTYIMRRGLLRHELEPLGEVTDVFDPVDLPGADVALIKLPNDSPRNGYGDIRESSSIGFLTKVICCGGISGTRHGWIADPVLSLKSVGRRIWENVWLAFERKGGLAQEGDSGSAIFDQDERAIGHLVGAMGYQSKGTMRQGGIIQDINSVLTILKRKTGKTYSRLNSYQSERDWRRSILSHLLRQ